MINKGIFFLLGLPRWCKRISAAIIDFTLCLLTTWFAFYLRLGMWIDIWRDQLTSDYLVGLSLAAFVSCCISIPIFIALDLYRAIFRYSGWPALLAVMRAISLYGVIYAFIFTVIGIQGVPRTIGLIQPLLLLFSVGASRALASHWLGNPYRAQLQLGKLPRVLIYGAGSAGRELAATIRNAKKMQVIGFIDEDKALQWSSLDDLKIYPPSQLEHLVKSLGISDILLALPHIGRSKRSEIINKLAKLKLSIRTMPNLQDLVSGKISVADLQDLDIDDLLGRNEVDLSDDCLKNIISNKVVMITGAGGSIGSELSRQVALLKPSHIILLEQSESALYFIEQEIREYIRCSDVNSILVTPILASVGSETAIRNLLGNYEPHIIFHAAAYKHVPLVEQNPVEGILNNVYGTLNIAKLASEFGVPNFVLISTDKAVRPTNIMGASKRLAEMILQALANHDETSTKTIFSMVRFGNVLNSSGSVVPLFRKQIQEGGPITLTHPEVTRFFMLIPEAAKLVIQASSLASGGEVFILDMDSPVKIADLAKKMIDLSGLTLRDENNPAGDIEIRIIGLRPGEKLYEELLIGNNPEPTTHPKILKAHEEFLPLKVLEQHLLEFEKILSKASIEDIKTFLRLLVHGYSS